MPQVLTFLSNLLVVTNSSVNILIYAFKVLASINQTTGSFSVRN